MTTMTDNEVEVLRALSDRSAAAGSDRVWGRHHGSLDEDLRQEAFIGAFLAHKSFHPSKGEYPHYVRAYAAGRVRQFQRDFVTHNMDLTLDEEIAGRDVLGVVDLREDLRRALATLPAADRKAVVLYHVLGWTQRDIAAELKCKQSTVCKLLRNGLKQLRSLMEAA